MNTPPGEPLFSEDDLFHNAFQHAAIGMALVGLGGEFLKVNDSLCALVGYAEAELKGLTFQDITHPEDLRIDLEHLRRLVAGEINGYRLEKRYFTKSGAIVWVLLSVSLVRDAVGGPHFFISQIQDITSRKEAERQRDALFDLPLFLHAVIGFDGFVKRVNPTWFQTFGYSPEFWQTTPYIELVHPEDRERAMLAVRDLAEKQMIRHDVRVRRADGHYIHTVWCARAEPSQGLFYASGFDATPLLEAQNKLQGALAEKEKLVADLRHSNSEIENLRSGLLTICAWTKRVRCKGKWMTVDEFLVNELGMNLTHGMSAEAETEFMGDTETGV